MSSRLIIAIIMFAAALPVGFLLDWPNFQKFQQLQVELRQKKAELDSKTSYYFELNKIGKKLEAYEDSLAQIEQAVSKSYSLPVLFNYFEELTAGTGLVLKDLNFEGVSGEGLNELVFNLEVSGSFSSFKNFLKALEQSARIFNVKKVNFSSPEEGLFSFQISIATYSY